MLAIVKPLDHAPPPAAEPSPPRFAALANRAAAGGGRSRLRAFEQAAAAALGPALVDVAIAQRGGVAQALAGLARTGANAVLVFGGDGTARTALEMLTPKGIAVAPIPGGTLNRLSRRLYGRVSLETILQRVFHGSAEPLPGGAIGAKRFFVASGYGEAMRFHGARELWRAGRPLKALACAGDVVRGLRHAPLKVGRAGTHADCAVVGVGPIDAAFGLAPLQEPQSFEAASAPMAGLGDLARTATSVLTGAWRRSPSIVNGVDDTIRVTSLESRPIPALLDGEFETLPPDVLIRYVADAGLIWR